MEQILLMVKYLFIALVCSDHKNFEGTTHDSKITSSVLFKVSPGSRAVMDDIRNRGSAGLSSSGSASGGSKSFKFLQQLTDQDAGS